MKEVRVEISVTRRGALRRSVGLLTDGKVEVRVTGLELPPWARWSPGALAGLMALAAGLAFTVSRACFSLPALVREARAYDVARDRCLQTQGRSGCRYEPAVFLGQHRIQGEEEIWSIRLCPLISYW